VCEKPGEVAPKDGGVWLDKQKSLLLASNPDSVIQSLKKLQKQGVAGVDKVIGSSNSLHFHEFSNNTSIDKEV
jgi:hypothetical protein